MNNIFLAVFGRGSMMAFPDGPWVPTSDLDIWDRAAKRPLVITSQDDSDPNCVIGGGNLNLEAAIQLYDELDPTLVVFAFGHKAPYLEEGGFPSESEVVTKWFLHYRPGARAEVFNPAEWPNPGSSSFREAANLLHRAEQLGATEIVFVTVLVHIARAMAFVAMHLKSPEFEGLAAKVKSGGVTIRAEISEFVLLRRNPACFANQCFDLWTSNAMWRNMKRDAIGVEMAHQGVTQVTQLTREQLEAQK